MVDLELREYIEERIITLYDHFDAGHRRDHVTSVIERSLKLAEHYDVNHDMVYAIAAYHDVGLMRGREKHHIYSKEYILQDGELNRWFSAEQIATMADAVEDHRASSKHAPRTIYGAIVAEADRVIVPRTIIRRTIQFTLHNHPELNKEEGYERMERHVVEKYGYGGYLKLWIEESESVRELEVLRQIIADKKELRRLYEEIYSEEMANN